MTQDPGQVLASVEHAHSLTESAHHLPGRVALPLHYRHPPLVGAGLTPQADRHPETPSGGTRTTVLALDRVWRIKASERARTADPARGYQELSAPLANPTTAEPTGGQAVCFSLSHNPKCVSYREMKRSARLLHPRSALVIAVRSSSPTLPTASNLEI
jgi:hypothetical protein